MGIWAYGHVGIWTYGHIDQWSVDESGCPIGYECADLAVWISIQPPIRTVEISPIPLKPYSPNPHSKLFPIFPCYCRVALCEAILAECGDNHFQVEIQAAQIFRPLAQSCLCSTEERSDDSKHFSSRRIDSKIGFIRAPSSAAYGVCIGRRF
jgi:hypothetical protein